MRRSILFLLLAGLSCIVPLACSNNYNLAPLSSSSATATPASTPYVITYAGSGSAGTSNGTGAAASFNRPVGMALDSSGNLYVADSINSAIRKITPGGVVSTYAGQPGVAGFANGAAASAEFNTPWDVATDSSGNVYVADSSNNLIRLISPGGVVSTFAGQAGVAGSANGPVASSSFYNPDGIFVDSSGNVYVTEASNYDVRLISGGIVSTLAGRSGINGFVNGPVATATFASVWGIGVDSSGNVYVGDWDNSAIRKISGGIVSTLAYIAGEPTAIAMDSSGNVYTPLYNGELIDEISPSGTVTTLAGVYNVRGATNGPALSATFDVPTGIAVDSHGDIFVGDQLNYVVREYIP